MDEPARRPAIPGEMRLPATPPLLKRPRPTHRISAGSNRMALPDILKKTLRLPVLG
jgi:hypothetical protein